jgi:phosphoribosylglycinamide formyltransferase-1
MYGDRVHQAVLDAKVDATGPTIHRVTDEYDAGEIVAHRRVEVRPDDTVETLGARVLAAEHDLYWRTIRALFCRPMTDRG